MAFGIVGNAGTGTGFSVREILGAIKAETGRVRRRNVHVPVGKVSFDARRLLENFRAVVDELSRAKPAASKGRYVRSVTVSSTMGPGVKIDPARIRLTDEDLPATA